MSDVTGKAKEFLEHYRTKKLLEEELNNVKEIMAQLEGELLATMDAEDVDKLSVNGATIYPREKVMVSMRKEQKNDAMLWLRENGYGEMIQPQVNAMTLSAAYKEAMEEGREELFPEELFNINWEKNSV